MGEQAVGARANQFAPGLGPKLASPDAIHIEEFGVLAVYDLPPLPCGLDAAALLSCIEAARHQILTVYEKADLMLEYKADRSPLTLADRQSHTVLNQGLQRLLPGVPVLSEEGTVKDWQVRRHWSLLWLVDPLDGTRDFVQRTGDFTINVALVEGHAPILGLLDIPLQNTTYLGIRGQGAYRIGEEEAKPIHTRHRGDSHGLTAAISRSHQANEIAWLRTNGFDVGDVIPAGSALKFALIAEGRADLYPRLGPTMEWDTAAGQCLVEAAGGTVTQLDGAALMYNRENLTNPPFLTRG